MKKQFIEQLLEQDKFRIMYLKWEMYIIFSDQISYYAASYSYYKIVIYLDVEFRENKFVWLTEENYKWYPAYAQ